VNPLLRLDSNYRNLAAHLQARGDKKVGNIKLQIAMENILIHRFDAAQESGNVKWDAGILCASSKQSLSVYIDLCLYRFI
jgi:hypothetical protein